MFRAGVPADEAARKIDLGKYGELAERGRIIQNVVSVYKTLDPTHEGLPQAEIFAHIGAIEGFTEEGK